MAKVASEKAGDLAREIGALMSNLHQYRVSALNAAANVLAGIQQGDAEVVRVQTRELRRFLEEIEEVASSAHGQLDELETEAGLVDDNGARFDERKDSGYGS